MSDLESRLVEALRAEAEEAPPAAGLAGAARVRARTRRRTRLVLGGVTAAAVLAISVVVVAPGGGDKGGDKLPASDLEPVDLGRWETWHGVTVRVPEDWGYGHLATWCLGGTGAPGEPVVERPGGTVEAIACLAPAQGYGVSIAELADGLDPVSWPVASQSSGSGFPVGAYVGATTVRGIVVTVVAEDEKEAQQILDSVARVDVVDPNGCPVGDDPTVLGSEGSVSVCRYDRGGGLLVQSERLTGSDAEDALDALDRAPETTYAPPCAPPKEPAQVQQYVLMLSESTRYAVVYQGDKCPDQGVFVDARERRELTADVLWWALSPGWTGAVGGDVPLPDPLRQRS